MVYNELTAILGVFKWLQNKLPMEKSWQTSTPQTFNHPNEKF